jgi:teichuronic acid biosynthesis glycosyltransferase TuaG
MDHNKPLVSIIMPVFNAGDYLISSIQSVLDQTYTNWQLIIINDGSTDNSQEIISNFLSSKKILNFTITNSGQAYARNYGLKYATGFFTAFIDADDIWFNNKLEIQIKTFQDNNIDLIFTDSNIIDKNGILTEESISPIRKKGIKYNLNNYISSNFFIPILTTICKTSILNQIGFFNESQKIKNAEDFDLWLRILYNKYNIFYIDTVTASYRVHSNQSTFLDYTSSVPVCYSLLNFKYSNFYHNNEFNKAILNRILFKNNILNKDLLSEYFKNYKFRNYIISIKVLLKAFLLLQLYFYKIITYKNKIYFT